MCRDINAPVEEPGLPLDSEREHKHPDETDCKERKDDPEGVLAELGSMEVVRLGGGLGVSARIGIEMVITSEEWMVMTV